MIKRFMALAVALALFGGIGYSLDPDASRTRVLGVKLTPSPAGLEGMPPADEDRGIVYASLERARDARCEGMFVTLRTRLCTHGPDPAPASRNVRADAPIDIAPEPTRSPEPDAPSPPPPPAPGGSCGTSGSRVQAVYARVQGAQDRFDTYIPSFRRWAAEADQVIHDSARETSGVRHMRFVTDDNCSISVERVVLTEAGASTFDDMIAEMRALGFDRQDRKYLVWTDAEVYCGIGSMWLDDSPGGENLNNWGPSYSRVDRGCWGYADAHEIMHNLGAVQPSAPHATSGHCTDEYDRMCYADSPGVQMQVICQDRGNEQRFDCGHDDYFHTAPEPGSYLARHWNAAASAFLSSDGTPPPAVTPPPQNPPVIGSSSQKSTTAAIKKKKGKARKVAKKPKAKSKAKPKAKPKKKGRR